MAGFVDTLAATGRTFAPQLRRVLIGLFLITAFFATGAVLLFVITADQLQSSMAAPGLNTIKSSIGAIRQDVASVEYYYKVLDVISKKQAEAEEGLSHANIKPQTALEQMTSAADDITAFIHQNDSIYVKSPLQIHLFKRPGFLSADPPMSQAGAPTPLPSGTATPSGSTAPPNPDAEHESIGDFGSMISEYFAQYYRTLDALPGDTSASRASLDMFRDKTNDRQRQFSTAHTQYDSSMSAVQSFRSQLSGLTTQKKLLDDTVAPAGSALANDEYWNLCEDFYSFKTLVGDWAYSIVLLPKMMLILTLSIFMGVLGSLIYLSQEFLKDPDGRGFWDILFRISLGAGVAFALFFFAAAGMLAMTQSSSGAAQSDMSPYLISFLGITGGYLSDRVTQWMREVGENTFKVNPGGPPPRWAIGLDAALKAAGLSSAALASASGATPGDVDAWVALTKAVPGDKQALIAAFLREHPSRIFTDIAPA